MFDQKDITKEWMRRLELWPPSPWETSSIESYRRKSTSPSHEQEVWLKCRNAKCVVWGDQWMHPACSSMMLDWIKSLSLQKPVWIVDRFDSKFSSLIQAYLDGKQSIAVFRNKASVHKPMWAQRDDFFALWTYIKTKKWKVHWIDAHQSHAKKNDLMACYVHQQKNQPVWVWTGALRISPLEQKKILIKCPTVWISLVDQTEVSKGHTLWRKNGENHFLYQGISPLYSLESIRLWQQHQLGFFPEDMRDHAQNIEHLIQDLFEDRRSSRSYQMYHVFSLRDLHMMEHQSQKLNFTSFLKKRILQGENLAIPEKKQMYLSSLGMGHLAEEIAHLWRIRTPHRGFYHTVIEECFGFMLSLHVDPHRDNPVLEMSEALPENLWTRAHAMGYHLGAKMFDVFANQSMKEKKHIKQCWNTSIPSEKQAKDIMDQLMKYL
ncbi:MAG: hypothetical protein R3A11_04375 [Bdellovibrionota bacterium]